MLPRPRALRPSSHPGLFLLLAPSVLAAGVALYSCSDSGTGGSGGGATSSSSAATTGSSTSTGSATGSGGGGGSSCKAANGTTQSIHDGSAPEGARIHLAGVVAMSQKFLRSLDSASGECIWGVYVSMPEISVAQEGSGVLVESVGFHAETSDGGFKPYCPELGHQPTGDAIPDDIHPGDVVDLTGEVHVELSTKCKPSESTLPEHVLRADPACGITKTGTAGVPQAHLLSPADVALLASPSDQTFHQKWEGVKIGMSNEVPVIDSVTHTVTIAYGSFTLVNGGVAVDNQIYYRGYDKSQVCHDGPKWAAPAGFKFLHIEGFSELSSCHWVVEPNDKCGDLSPPSDDCTGQACL